MSNHDRQRWRAAVLLRSTLVSISHAQSPIDFSNERWERIQATLRHLHHARRRSWDVAERHCRETIRSELASFTRQLERLGEFLATPQHFVPSLQTLDRDLASLADDFDEVRIDLRSRELAVVTDRVLLEEIDLGRFAIVLEIDRLGASRPYRIEALDPHPAASNDDVVHPHVQGERLCEGDGHEAIQRSLADGNIADFFLFVRQILHTYNPDSPYVRLEEWEEQECPDCGGLAAELTECRQCRSSICFDCLACCGRCCDGFCASCLESCSSCRDVLCSECMTYCDHCSTNLCQECMSDDGLCHECHRKQEEEADAAILPDGLGETALSS